jgi:hypothetical protein
MTNKKLVSKFRVTVKSLQQVIKKLQRAGQPTQHIEHQLRQAERQRRFV